MNTVTTIAAAVRNGKISAKEVCAATLKRIERVEGHVRAFLTVDSERAMWMAERVDQARARGEELPRLAGVPLAIKDNLCTRFSVTSCGSKIMQPFRSQYDAHVVERLEGTGAIIFGKTNLDEFAMGGSTENSAFFPSLNPWDPKRVPGGSSGGSAVAVATRMMPGALGSDTGGSIRLPASMCGVVGLKPTYGRVSRYGLVAFGSSLDQVGPIATDAADAALLLSVIAGHDERDSTCSAEAPPDYIAALGQPIKGLRIGISEEYFGEGIEPLVRRRIDEAIEELKRAGAELVNIRLPHMKYAVACYYLIATAEASSNLARFDGVHYGFRAPQPKDIYDLYAATRGAAFGAEVKRRIMLGTYVLSRGYYDAYYLKALKVRTLIKRDFDAAFERVHVIASPVSPTTAFKLGEKAHDPLSMYLADIYTISANLAGICAISIPCGFDDKGLPVGLQLMGRAFDEATLLAATHQYQQRTNHHEKLPPLSPGI